MSNKTLLLRVITISFDYICYTYTCDWYLSFETKLTFPVLTANRADMPPSYGYKSEPQCSSAAMGLGKIRFVCLINEQLSLLQFCNKFRQCPFPFACATHKQKE